MTAAALTADDLRRHAETCWARQEPQAALQAAWAAFDVDAGERAAKRLVARLLQHYPGELNEDRRADYLKLLTDREVEPDLISTAGWRLMLRHHQRAADAADGDTAFAGAIAELERDELVKTLLRESPVYDVPAERLLTRLRRWLLLSGEWRSYGDFVAALKIQAGLNGGAWPFDDGERARLAQAGIAAMTAVYVPAGRRGAEVTATWDPVTRAVAAQYERWPYPAWTRITVAEPRRLPDVIRPMDAAIGNAMPVEASVLVAGCGTGRQAAYVAATYPDAKVTAIDVSEASLDYARRQCAALGIANVQFMRLDLHDVAKLGERFHAIFSAGVLHHIADPERGFKVLADVLQPDGVMQIMVYNRLQRLMIAAARTLVADVLREPVDDDLLREVRRRLLERSDHGPAAQAMRSRDFATLAGTHDLLLHRHEDPFDVTRVERAIERAGLRLLRFDMLSPVVAARYDALFPNDPAHRDIGSWARFARSDADAISHHLRFWCGQTRH